VTETGVDGKIELFGEKILLKKVGTTYKGLTMKNPEVVKRKYKDFEDGEQVKAILIPTGKNHVIEEQYYI
jgi:hypothetical protein